MPMEWRFVESGELPLTLAIGRALTTRPLLKHQ
jgi:hypothetical protein